MNRSLAIFYFGIFIAARAYCSLMTENFAVDDNMTYTWLYDNMSYSMDTSLMDNLTLPPVGTLDFALSSTTVNAAKNLCLLNRKLLYIQGLFELSKTSFAPSGRSEKTAAELAIKHVNEQQVIKGYELSMYSNDTQEQGSGMYGPHLQGFCHLSCDWLEI